MGVFQIPSDLTASDAQLIVTARSDLASPILSLTCAGSTFIVACADGTLRALSADLSEMARVATGSEVGQVEGISWLGDTAVAASAANGTLQIWSISEGEAGWAFALEQSASLCRAQGASDLRFTQLTFSKKPPILLAASATWSALYSLPFSPTKPLRLEGVTGFVVSDGVRGFAATEGESDDRRPQETSMIVRRDRRGSDDQADASEDESGVQVYCVHANDIRRYGSTRTVLADIGNQSDTQDPAMIEQDNPSEGEEEEQEETQALHANVSTSSGESENSFHQHEPSHGTLAAQLDVGYRPTEHRQRQEDDDDERLGVASVSVQASEAHDTASNVAIGANVEEIVERVLAGVSKVVEEVVRAEVRREVGTALTLTVVPTLTHNVNQSVAQAGNNMIQATHRVQNVMVQTVSERFNAIAAQTTQKLMTQLSSPAFTSALVSASTQAVTHAFATTVVPAHEQATQRMFQQISNSFENGFEKRLKATIPSKDELLSVVQDAARQSEAASRNALEEVRNAFNSELANIGTQVYQLQTQLSNEREKSHAQWVGLRDQLAKQTQLLEQIAAQRPTPAAHPAFTPPSLHSLPSPTHHLYSMSPYGHGHHPPPPSPFHAAPFSPPSQFSNRFAIMSQLEGLVAAKEINGALFKVLEAYDTAMVMWLCDQLGDPKEVFRDNSDRLACGGAGISQQVLVSLVQQLAFDLSVDRLKKLAWLRYSILALDVSDRTVRAHAVSVLGEVMRKVDTMLTSPDITSAEMKEAYAIRTIAEKLQIKAAQQL
eukprot:c9267_g1_i1.p1 GENE.c9267_g1_i1~~c9267_g1_i1.p1  ORF type:complete len:775 (-),score=189.53 c9267_g1_i1:100-2424(-)